MSTPTPSEAVRRLISAGWSEARIAKEVGTSQPTIHRVKHGQKSVAFEVGLALVRLAGVADGEQAASSGGA